MEFYELQQIVESNARAIPLCVKVAPEIDDYVRSLPNTKRLVAAGGD